MGKNARRAKSNAPTPYKLSRTVENGLTQNRAVARCKCGNEMAVYLSHHLPPDVIVKKFVTAGWLIKNTKMTCQRCVGRIKENRKEGPMAKTVEQATVTALHTGDPVTQNPLKQRRLFEAIEAAFDEKRGRYKNPNESDATIAKDTGFSEEYVATVRRGAFGEIKVDPAMETLLDNMVKLGAEVKDMTEMFGDLIKRIEKSEIDLRNLMNKLPT